MTKQYIPDDKMPDSMTIEDCCNWITEDSGWGSSIYGWWNKNTPEPHTVQFHHPSPGTLDVAAKSLPKGWFIEITHYAGLEETANHWRAEAYKDWDDDKYEFKNSVGATGSSELEARFRVAVKARILENKSKPPQTNNPQKSDNWQKLAEETEKLFEKTSKLLQDATSLLSKTEQKLIDSKSEIYKEKYNNIRQGLKEIAELDCSYPDQPCLSVHISQLKHGMCIGCKAKLILSQDEDKNMPINNSKITLPAMWTVVDRENTRVGHLFLSPEEAEKEKVNFFHTQGFIHGPYSVACIKSHQVSITKILSL